MASEHYPASSPTGFVIEGLDADLSDCKVFHAGTAEVDGKVTTAGGRVLCVTAMGDDLDEASDLAYQATVGITWSGAKYRRDIGWRARTR